MSIRRFTEVPDEAAKKRKLDRQLEDSKIERDVFNLPEPETIYDYLFLPKDYARRHRKLIRYERYKGLLSVRILLKGSDAAKLTGDSCETVHRINSILEIRKQFHCDAKLSDGSVFDSERILWLKARQDDFEGILEVLLPFVSFHESSYEEKELQILVPQAFIGCIIGSRGDRVKSIRREAHVNITIYRDCLPHSNERAVSIIGKPGQIKHAVHSIVDFLSVREEEPGHDDPPVIFYEPCKTRWEIPGEYGGYTYEDVSDMIFEDLKKCLGVSQATNTNKPKQTGAKMVDYSAVPPEDELAKTFKDFEQYRSQQNRTGNESPPYKFGKRSSGASKEFGYDSRKY
ncbi:Heterogeneous nuclear ribonucleoprotein K-like [Oopsacas minuta]|uniref:Heterogeneous nuclear ribonucleoprotein K-like n=1 Tax=Oopsacas minuta TaxID=111878 RepID=A0AAV7JXK1_9METZ|nr:Heterogeneous nuclear ribonucleoprotein K-like [Oopsacas minuta]